MIKKYHNGAWETIPYKRYETSTDTITTLPAEVIADGNDATIGLAGNMSQTGTPTPQNPIEPSECGERTGNLFDVSTATNEFLNSNGSITPATAGDPYYLSDYISADNVTISVQYKETALAEIFIVGIYDSSKSFIRRDVISNNSVSYENVAYIRINYRDINCQNAMLNTGSTALPYEPYGYKIPILSGGTTTNVYLGEVQSTRQIKKLVLTGQETINISSPYYLLAISIPSNDRNNFICSHFDKGGYSGAIAQGNLRFAQGGSVQYDTILFNYDNGIGGEANFKAYLQQQYANGTPVTVWYVLATPTTGIVNEPLRKIGDYADTVSGISVPTLGTSEQFDVDTTLKPSKVDLTYTGWHNKSDTKF